jgi:hypothetical protein
LPSFFGLSTGNQLLTWNESTLAKLFLELLFMSTHILPLIVAAWIAALFSPSPATAQPADGERQRQRGQFGQRGDRGLRGVRGGQFGERGRGAAGITSVTLLRIEQIRGELKLDEAQAATIDAAIEAFREERREGRPDREAFQNLSDEEREQLRDERQAAQQELTSKTDEVISVLLKSEQNARLRELLIQVNMKTNPIGTLKSDDMKATLHLSKHQIGRIDEIEESMRREQSATWEAMREAFSSQNGERPDFTQVREKMQNLNQKFNKQVLGVLTADQSSELQAMQGEAMEIDLQSIRGNRRGRDDGRRRRGRGGDDSGNRRRARPPVDDDSA